MRLLSICLFLITAVACLGKNVAATDNMNVDWNNSQPISALLSYMEDDGEPVLLLTLQNRSSEPIFIDRSHLCVDGPMSAQLFRVYALRDEMIVGEVGYKGVIVNRLVENAPEHFYKFEAGESMSCSYRLKDYYKVSDSFQRYKVTFSRRNLAYKNSQPEFIISADPIFVELKGVN